MPRSSVACLRRPQRFPTDALPFRASPSREAVLASPRVLAPLSFNGNAAATSRPCSARESVATKVRGRTPSPDALLGFPAWSPTRTCEPIHPRTDGPVAPGICANADRSGGQSTRSVPPPPEGSDHTERTGKERSGRHHCRATMPADQRPSATPPKQCPRRSAPRTTSSSLANPAAPREVIGRCRHDSPEGARTASASELSMVPCAAWIRPPKRSTPSAPPRSVRSAAAVEGVRVADGLIGSRSVAQGRAIGAKTPASARRREVPSYVSTARVRSVARAALLRRAAVPNVGV